uniref:Uncharacterized protein n=1 Tax=mine drainage metagenome TaxID=410659 RepID=E6PLP9_9ZZZZ
MKKPNPAVKRDCAKARSPFTLAGIYEDTQTPLDVARHFCDVFNCRCDFAALYKQIE